MYNNSKNVFHLLNQESNVLSRSGKYLTEHDGKDACSIIGIFRNNKDTQLGQKAVFAFGF